MHRISRTCSARLSSGLGTAAPCKSTIHLVTAGGRAASPEVLRSPADLARTGKYGSQRRFAVRVRGLACGLALAVRPEGRQGPTMRGVPVPVAVTSSRLLARLA